MTWLREHVWPLFPAGKLKPVIYRVFPLAEAAAAHALLAPPPVAMSRRSASAGLAS